MNPDKSVGENFVPDAIAKIKAHILANPDVGNIHESIGPNGEIIVTITHTPHPFVPKPHEG